MLAYSNADEALFDEIVKTQKLGLKVVFKHSSLTSGDDVYFGGMYKWKEKTWDEQSGHYRPQPIHLASCKAWHEKNGVDDFVYVQHKKVLGKRKKSESSEDLTA